MKLVILGSSSGLASAHRASSSYLFDLGDEGVLIDCGDGATRNFLAAGYRPEWVRELLISHTHADHVCGLSYFVQQRYLSGTSEPLRIHCPDDAIDAFKAILNLGYLFPERLPFTIDYEPLVKGQTITRGGITISPYPTSHLASMTDFAATHGYPNRGECFAMHVKAGKTAILYSADLGSLDDLNAIKGTIDWLLIESTHVALDQLWPWAEDRGVRRIILTHIADDFDPQSITGAGKFTSAEVMLAEDRMVLVIP